MEKIFEKATRLKVRFSTSKGLVTVEDLWDIPLTSRTTGYSLDDIAKNLNKKLKDSEEESFVVKKSTKNELLDLEFCIVKHIIGVRLQERDAATAAKAKAMEKQKILSLIEDKKDEDLKNKSLEELEALLKDTE